MTCALPLLAFIAMVLIGGIEAFWVIDFIFDEDKSK
jgi:hypothetical protein